MFSFQGRVPLYTEVSSFQGRVPLYTEVFSFQGKVPLYTEVFSIQVDRAVARKMNREVLFKEMDLFMWLTIM